MFTGQKSAAKNASAVRMRKRAAAQSAIVIRLRKRNSKMQGDVFETSPFLQFSDRERIESAMMRFGVLENFNGV